MDIAAISMGLSRAKVQQQAGLAVMKLAMNSVKERASAVAGLAQTTKVSEGSPAHPFLGRALDIRV